MANHCRTSCTITGPDAEIERFKQTCFVTARPIPGYADYGDGVDFYREEWKATTLIWWCHYFVDEGKHQLHIKSNWEPPVASPLSRSQRCSQS